VSVAGFLSQDRVAGRNAHSAPIRHGIAGVVREVEQRIFELPRIDQDTVKVVGESTFDFDVFTQRPPQQLGQVGDKFIGIGPRRAECLPP